MLMVQQCAGQRGQRPAQAEIALGNKLLILISVKNLERNGFERTVLVRSCFRFVSLQLQLPARDRVLSCAEMSN